MSNEYLFTLLALCRKDDIEGVFYTLIALLKVKLSRISSYTKKLSSDSDLIKALGNIKDNKQLESQKELMIIKETKKNLSE
jgi:hypothetical protein